MLLETGKLLVVLFVSVSVLVALGTPNGTLPKLRLDGVSDTGVIPVPESPTVSGLPEAPNETVSVPAGCAPSAVGVKVSATVQLRPAPRVGIRQVEEGSMEYGDPAVTESDEMLRLVVR
jgi:hypothetical protein